MCQKCRARPRRPVAVSTFSQRSTSWLLRERGSTRGACIEVGRIGRVSGCAGSINASQLLAPKELAVYVLTEIH